MGKHDPEENGRALAREMFQKLNIMGGEKEFIDGFVAGVTREHRTLQQAFGRLVIRVMLKFADDHQNRYCDLRNEAFCELCAEIRPMLEKAALPFV